MADTSQPNRVVLHIDADTSGAERKIARVEEILNNAELSEKSKVASIAALYKKQGAEASAAMQRAWREVRGAAQSAAVPVQQQGSLLDLIRAKSTELTGLFRQLGTSGKGSGEQVRGSFLRLNSAASTLTATLGRLFAVTRVVAWGRACVTASNETENALRGLSSILNGQGRSFDDAQTFIQSYIADGLVPLENAVTSYKNLAARGYDDTQIRRVMTALKDSAAYGRQASYSLGDAVMSATEGLKNENSILVDNAGVTKNVAKMWEDYAKSIGTTANDLTQQQKIQAEVNGILTETRFQTGDAAKIAGTFSGQVSQLTANVRSFNAVAGDFIKTALTPMVTWLNRGFQAATLFLQTIGKGLGISLDTSQFSAMSSGIAQAAENTENLTGSLITAKAAQDKLLAAGFDEFNIIGTQNDDDDDDEAPAAVTAAVQSPDLTGLSLGTQEVSGELDGLTEKVRTFAGNWLTGWGIIKGGWEDFKDNWLTGFGIIKEYWLIGWGVIKETLSTGWNEIEKWANSARGKWNSFKENWKSSFEGFGGWLYDRAQDWSKFWGNTAGKTYRVFSDNRDKIRTLLGGWRAVGNTLATIIW